MTMMMTAMKRTTATTINPCWFFVFFLLSLCTTSIVAAEEVATDETPLAVKTEVQNHESIEDSETVRLLRYRPMYFAHGEPTTKVQISFRSPIIENLPLYFAYTQIIFWELGRDSRPFLDGTYNPELFYRLNFVGTDLTSVDLGLWEHRSNGKDGELSRSIDGGYLRLNMAFKGLRWTTKLFAQLGADYNKDETNRDFDDFVGPLRTGISFLQEFDDWLDKAEISVHLQPGGKYAHDWSKGGYEISTSFHIGGVNIVPSFYLQYYEGYGESLLNYNEKVSKFRAGIMF